MVKERQEYNAMLIGALNDAVNNNTVCQKLTEVERLDVGQKFDKVVIRVILNGPSH